MKHENAIFHDLNENQIPRSEEPKLRVKHDISWARPGNPFTSLYMSLNVLPHTACVRPVRTSQPEAADLCQIVPTGPAEPLSKHAV